MVLEAYEGIHRKDAGAAMRWGLLSFTCFHLRLHGLFALMDLSLDCSLPHHTRHRRLAPLSRRWDEERVQCSGDAG
jgi:hypothetical protein